MSWCDFNDMPSESCAHCQGTPELDVRPTYAPIHFAPRMEARYPGVCGHCGDRVQVGDPLVLCGADDGSERAWCLVSHVSSDTA